MTIEKIELRQTLKALRDELALSTLFSEGEEIRFEVGEIELEVQFVIEKTKGANGKIKFWVVEMGGGISEKNATVQKLKIPLKPVWKDNPDKSFYTKDQKIPD
ncbi:MAG: trypco2 family protein [Crocosphaera sp.]